MAFFAASCDDVDTNARFAESLGLEYPILSDPEKSVALAYGVVTDQRPFPFRWTFYIGADGKILAIDTQVNPTTAGATVASTLAALGIEAAD